jgi:hypothetical protein
VEGKSRAFVNQFPCNNNSLSLKRCKILSQLRRNLRNNNARLAEGKGERKRTDRSGNWISSEGKKESPPPRPPSAS